MKLEDVILRGDRASQPSFSAVPIGTVYCVTDEGDILERSSGAAWESYSPAAAVSGINQLTGDVTAGPGTGSQAATIANNAVTTSKINAAAVTYAKIQDVSATARILARKTSGAGSVEESTISEILDFLASVARGNIIYRNATEWVVLAPGTAGQVLQTGGAGADPSWTTNTAGIDQLTGDVTAGPGSGSQAATIANNAVTTSKINAGAVTYAKIQDVSATARILARKTSGAGSVEESTVSEVLDFLSGVARGNIIYRNATEWVVLAPGTAGQVLQTNGAGADPSWATASGGDTGSFLVVPQTTMSWQIGYNTSGTFDIVPLNGGSSPTVGFNVLTKDTSHSDNLYGTIASQASAGSDFGWRTSNFTLVQRQWFPTYETIILSPDIITSVRMWVGLTSAQMTDSDTAPGHFMGFRFSTVAGDTGWTPITRDGATQNAATTIGTVAANTAYRLKIRCTSGHVFFSVNGGTETDVTSNLPTSTQDLGVNHRGFTQNGTAKKMGICRSRLVFGTQP